MRFALDALFSPSNQLTRALGFVIVVGIAYYLAAWLGVALRAPVGAAAFWPAAGIGVAALVVFGQNARVAISAAVAIATIAVALTSGRSPSLAIVFGLINAGQALLTAYLVERWFDRPFGFDDVRHVLGFVVAAILGAVVSGVAGVAAMTLLSTTVPSWELGLARCLSRAVGVVLVAPLLIGLAQLWRERPSNGERLEGVGVLALLGLASLYTVTSPAESWVTFSPSALVLPFLLWLTARCRPAFGIAGAFVVSAAVLLAMTIGVGRFGDPSVAITERIAGAQATITVITLFTLVLTALFTEKQRNEAELRRAAERQRLLIAELNHRVKNVLATVAAVASRIQNASHSAADFAAKLTGRIQSMAATHELISLREWKGVSMRELVQRELAPYMAKNTTELHGPDLTLSPNAGQVVSMVLHELATNAAKHGALSVDDGRVSVRWNRAQKGSADTSLCIEWQESGCFAVQSPREPGYGTEVIRDLVPHELGGTVNLEFAPKGLRCAISIPFTEVSSSARDENG